MNHTKMTVSPLVFLGKQARSGFVSVAAIDSALDALTAHAIACRHGQYSATLLRYKTFFVSERISSYLTQRMSRFSPAGALIQDR